MPLAQEAPLPDFAVEVNTVDRRREGRLEIDNPHLIDMLRRPEFMSIEEALAENGQVIDVGPATRLDRAAFPLHHPHDGMFLGCHSRRPLAHFVNNSTRPAI